ncbi:MAG: flagellar hook-basal body protein [Sedimentibacter sp.]|jgi:flagellar basal-body rod protein FlgG|nr:flagellar hook-basal body protein [Sedimentibacter sp.]
MIKAYYTATNGAMSNQNYLDVLSNNMANLQTEGFKKTKAEFSDLLYTNIREPEGANSDLKSGSGSKINKTDVIFSQGAPYLTGAPTDFAITGEGFFAIQFEEENLFTRGGSFDVTNIDDENYLTYQGGYVLNKEEEPIIIENTDDILDVGVFAFANNADLAQAGNNLYRIANEEAEYSLLENAKVMKGYLEASNVEVSEEMVKLIQIQRAFQLNSKIIQTADEIEQTINSLKG